MSPPRKKLKTSHPQNEVRHSSYHPPPSTVGDEDIRENPSEHVAEKGTPDQGYEPDSDRDTDCGESSDSTHASPVCTAADEYRSAQLSEDTTEIKYESGSDTDHQETRHYPDPAGISTTSDKDIQRQPSENASSKTTPVPQHEPGSQADLDEIDSLVFTVERRIQRIMDHLEDKEKEHNQEYLKSTWDPKDMFMKVTEFLSYREKLYLWADKLEKAARENIGEPGDALAGMVDVGEGHETYGAKLRQRRQRLRSMLVTAGEGYWLEAVREKRREANPGIYYDSDMTDSGGEELDSSEGEYV